MAKPAKALPPLPKLLARVTGARLCFGGPIAANGRTVIPVASVRTVGGGGFGGAPAQGGTGGGGGGMLEAHPVGFIEVTAEGTRFERIDDGRMALRAMAAGSLAVLVAGRVLTAPSPAAAAGLGVSRSARARAPRDRNRADPTAAAPRPAAALRRRRAAAAAALSRASVRRAANRRPRRATPARDRRGR